MHRSGFEFVVLCVSLDLLPLLLQIVLNLRGLGGQRGVLFRHFEEEGVVEDFTRRCSTQYNFPYLPTICGTAPSKIQLAVTDVIMRLFTIEEENVEPHCHCQAGPGPQAARLGPREHGNICTKIVGRDDTSLTSTRDL